MLSGPINPIGAATVSVCVVMFCIRIASAIRPPVEFMEKPSPVTNASTARPPYSDANPGDDVVMPTGGRAVDTAGVLELLEVGAAGVTTPGELAAVRPTTTPRTNASATPTATPTRLPEREDRWTPGAGGLDKDGGPSAM